MSRRGRVLLSASLILLGLPGLLWLFADAGRGLSWQAQERQPIDLDRARSETSTLVHEADGLRVSGADRQGRALVLFDTDAFDLENLPLLEVQLAETSPLDAARVVLSVGGELRVAPFPGHPGGRTVIDLRRAGFGDAEVRGVGLMFLPPDTLPGSAAAGVDLRITRLALSGPSLGGYLRSLGQYWFGYRPWTGRSNHTAGFEHGTQPPPGLQALLAAWLGWSLLVLAVFCRERLCSAGAHLLLACVLMLAAASVWQLLQRAEVSWRSAQAVDALAGARQSALPELDADMAGLVAALSKAPPTRIVVWGGNGFLREYPVWLLRQFPVGGLHRAAQLAQLDRQTPTLLVIAGQNGWRYDFQRGRLRVDRHELAATPVFRSSWVTAFHIAARRDGQ